MVTVTDLTSTRVSLAAPTLIEAAPRLAVLPLPQPPSRWSATVPSTAAIHVKLVTSHLESPKLLGLPNSFNWLSHCFLSLLGVFFFTPRLQFPAPV